MTTQLYRLRAHPSNLRSMSSTLARAIPLAHDRMLAKEEPAATARPAATRSPAPTSVGESFVAEAVAAKSAMKAIVQTVGRTVAGLGAITGQRHGQLLFRVARHLPVVASCDPIRAGLLSYYPRAQSMARPFCLG